MLWKPVLMSPGGPSHNTCPIPPSGLTISILEEPPFTEFKSGKVKGILGEFFNEIQKKCFINALECKSAPRNVTIKKLFNSSTSFKSAIEGNETDIAFPITAPLKMHLSGDRYFGPGLIFEEFIESTGYSLIMDVANFNQRTNDIVFHTLLVNTWPIFVFTLLIAGISGICVWMLVSKMGLTSSNESRGDICTFAVFFSVSRPFFALHWRALYVVLLWGIFKKSEVIRLCFCKYLEVMGLCGFRRVSAWRFAEFAAWCLHFVSPHNSVAHDMC